MKAMADGDNNIWELTSTDILVEILLRLPTSSRRRFRLACRLWRDIIDTRTTEMQSHAKMLVATVDGVYLVEDGVSSSRWIGAGDPYHGMSLVGTCNGLVCMCDTRNPSGPITLANPITGETLAIPPPPPLLTHIKAASDLRLTFTLAYHPTTGRYKVLHVPYSFDRVWVFTLGEALWRDVATGSPIEPYDISKGIVNINGTVHWAVKGMKAKVLTFDLDSEHISSIRPLPNVLSRRGSFHLMEARGSRLGIAFSHESSTSDKTEVWVMEHAMVGPPTWSPWYNIIMQKPQDLLMHRHQLTLPNFTTHDNDYVLTMRWELCIAGGCHGYVLYKHKPRNDVKKARHGVVEISEWNRGKEVGIIPADYIRPRTFAYVETTEPLSAYRCW
ncbi:unnamed protein product [Alopecurus aequalis]